MSDETKKQLQNKKMSAEDVTSEQGEPEKRRKKNRSITHTGAIMHLPIDSGRLFKTFKYSFGCVLLSCCSDVFRLVWFGLVCFGSV